MIRKLGLALALSACLATAATAQTVSSGVVVGPGGVSITLELGYQQTTGVSAATGITPPAGARVCVVQPEAQAVRYRLDGTNPTASVGMNLAIGTPLVLTTGGMIATAKFIPVTGTAILNIDCYE